MTTMRKTLATALTALVLATALAPTGASARGFGGGMGGGHHHGRGHGWGGWHHRHWGGYYVGGGCWRWFYIPGLGVVRKNVCWIY